MNRPTVRIKPRKKLSQRGSVFLILVLIGGLLYTAAFPLYVGYLTWQLQQGPVILQVLALAQSQTTSCGEAAITMAHNFAHPDDLVSEQMVIEYAAAQGYFTPGVPPYTSPANMVRIARHYAQPVDTGSVVSSGQGLTLLIERLQDGEPVIIDVLTRLNDPDSEAHFLVVTGVSLDPNRDNAVVIHYNDPLTGRAGSADWAGETGIWNAWQNNGDPGGAGWWMVVDVPV
jgi:hypothetical protein